MEKAIFHETKTHGKLSFPYVVYAGKIPQFINSYPLHWHEEMELIYIKNGTGLITVQSTAHVVHGGDVIVLLPQIVHSIEQYKDETMEYYNILFRFSMLNYSASDACYEKYFKPLYNHTKTLPSHQLANSPLTKIILPHIQYLIDNRHKSYTEDELLVQSSLLAIVHYINQASKVTSNAELVLQNNYEKLKPILLTIHNHYDTDITVEDAASMCGFSNSHFMRIFKELTGKSLIKYIKNYRLEMATAELTTGNEKIIDLAGKCGFHNLSYFTRAFAEKYGVTPSEYRGKGRL